MGEMRNAFKMLVGRPVGKRPCGGPRLRWDDNISIDVRKIGWGGVDWLHLVQDMDQ
jgi:hypothetical protein